MKQKLLNKLLALTLFILLGAFCNPVWATPSTIASLINNTTTGWTISGATSTGSGTGLYWLLTYSSNTITTPSINWDDYTNLTIKIKARTYGGPSTSEAKISVKQASTELTSYTPSSKTLTYSSELEITPSGTSSLVIACLGASSNKGSGVSEIIIKGELASTGEATTVTIDASGINNNLFGSNTDGGSLSATVIDNSSKAIDAATVTWSGDDDDVATINASTGVVTLVGVGSVNLKATYAGVKDTYLASNATYKLTVVNEDPSLVEIWSEDFASSGYSTRASTYSYATTNSSAVQSSDNYAGGDAPEMMLKASSGTFSATIPLNNGYTGDLKMKFKSNANSITVSSGTTGVSMSGTASFTTKGTHEVTFTGITAENTNINVVFTCGTSNVRLDDIVLKGKEAPAKPTFSESAKLFNSSFDMTISSETGTTLKYTTDGTNPATSGTATSVASNSKEITISGTSNVTVKAIAIKDEDVSAVASVTYTYDARPAPTFTLSDSEMTIYVNSDDETITLTTNSDGNVTFESSDGKKLDVDNTDDSKVGVMTAIEAGDYTVTVRTSATVNYLAGEGTVTVHVIKLPTTITTTASFTSTDLKDASSGSFTGVAKYNDAAIVGAVVTYSSSNTKVATINSTTGAVNFLKAGTTRLTASYEGTEDYAACETYYDLTLIDTRPQAAEVNITFGNALYGTSYTGTGAAGNGPFEGTVNNVTVTVSQGSGSNLYVTNSETRIYGGTTKGTITIAAPTGYLITKIVFNGGTAPSKWDITASPGSLSTVTWTGEASSVVFSASARSDFQSAKVTLAPVVTVTASGYLSYCSPHKLDFSETDVKAYKAAVDEDGKVTLTKVDIVPAEEGVILFSSEAKEANEATTYSIPVTDKTASDVTGNQMVGVLERTQVLWNVGDKYNYILQQGKFNKATNGYLKANRAYLSTSYDVSAASARELTIVFDDDVTTGISTIESTDSRKGIYNLAGQRLNSLQKGINIVNGKIIMVK